MPRMNNVFMGLTPIGDALKNFTNAYFSGPSPADLQLRQAQAAYQGAMMEKAGIEAEANRRELAGKHGVASLFSSIPGATAAQSAPVADPGAGGPARAMAATAAGNTRDAGRSFMENLPARMASYATEGGIKGDDLANMFRFYVANSGGSDADTVRALVGSGKTLGVNDAVSLGHQGDIAARNAGNDLNKAVTVQDVKNAGDMNVRRLMEAGLMSRIDPQANADIRVNDAKIYATPMTESQVKGGIISKYGPEDQRIAALGSPAYGPSKTQVEGGILQGLPVTDQRAATMGDALSPIKIVDPTSGSGARYVTKSDSIGESAPMPNAANAADAGIKKTVGQVMDSNRNIERSRSFADMARKAGSDPRNYGFAGFLRGSAQDAIHQGDALLSMFGQQGAQIKSDILASGYDIDPRYFDQNIPQKEFIINVLAYDLARTVAEQSGHSLSDRDFMVWRKTISGAGPLNNKADFFARLDLVDRILSDIESKNNDYLSSIGQPVTQAPADAGGVGDGGQSSDINSLLDKYAPR